MKRIIFSFIFCLKKAWKNSRQYFFLTIIKNVFLAVIPLVNIAGLGVVINALTSGKALRSVVNYIVIYVLINLAITFSTQLLGLWENISMRKSSNILQYKYINDCINIDYHYVQDGKIQNLKRQSMLSQPPFFLNHWGNMISYIIRIISVLSIFLLFSPLFMLIILCLSALLILLTIYIQNCDYDFNNKKVDDDRKLDYLYDIMTDYKYAKEIRINNAKEFINNKFISVLKDQTKKLKQLMRKKIRVNLLRDILSVMQIGSMFLYFSYQVFSKQISIAEYSVLISSTTLFTSALLSCFSTLGIINNTFKAIDFDREYEQILNSNSKLSKSNEFHNINVDFSKSTIKFENVSFIYPDSTDYVLKDISFDITAGKKYAIVGLNGSGKTTLVKLLLRLYSPTFGKIKLNGININEIPYQQYISKIACVLQDFSIFAYSIKENVVFDGTFNESRFNDCIEKSGLKEKITTLPLGSDTYIYRKLNDEGIEFSGGEGQKLAMARAVYKNADIIILDEPTSALDPLAECEVFSRLNEISNNKTTVYISHRLSSTRFCDEIIVINNKKIIEQGNHQTLIEKKGFYATLYNSQSKYYHER